MAAAAAAAAGAGGISNGAYLGSAGISAGSGLLGSIVGAIQQRKTRQWQNQMVNAQHKFEHNEAALAREWQERMWNEENLYNTPLAQLQRGLEAGMNPNDIFGSNSANAAMNVPSGAQASGGATQSPYTADIGGLVASSIGSMANNLLSLSQAKKTEKEADWIDKEKSANIDLVKAETDKVIKEKEVNHEQANLLRQTNSLYEAKTEAEINQINAAAQLAAQQILESKQRVKNLTEEEKLKQKENIILGVKSGLASKFGLVVDSDGLTALITLLCSPNGADLVSTLGKNIGNILSTAGDAFGDVFDGAIDGVTSAVTSVPKTIFGKLKDFGDELNRWFWKQYDEGKTRFHPRTRH